MNFELIAKLFDETEGLTNITLTIKGDQINIVKPVPIKEKERNYFKVNDIVIDLKYYKWGIGRVIEINCAPASLKRLTVEFEEVGTIETYTTDGRYTTLSEPTLKRILI